MKAASLWTKNFTILTLGSAVSMIGNAVSGFAISLLMLDKTGSVFLYALFLAAYNLPKIILPLVAGPFLDNRSRRKTIFTLDFISASIFLLMFFIIKSGFFSYPLFLLLVIVIGSVDSVYYVAYDSLFPILVSEGNFTKAYSVASLLEPIATIMVPIAAVVYNTVGLAPLFLVNAISFLVAAICETQIKVEEAHILKKTSSLTFAYLKDELVGGLKYINREKGLKTITSYFFLNAVSGMGAYSLNMPYFKSVPSLGVMAYSYSMASNVTGRLAGGLLHYRFKYPVKKKFAIALTVYTAISFIEGGVLYTPLFIMLPLFFLDGIMGVTSYNIRLSTTQSYVPNDMRGRFNGVFQMVCNAGTVVGTLLAGALAEFLPIRPVVTGLMVINLIAAFAIMFRGRREVAKIYNRDV
ncbi:MAG: MFS transporter [Oscillospiraceae bacterium]